MVETSYVAADSSTDLEWERLGLLEEIYDAISTQYITALGVTPGWRCAEIGAGRGSISRWLAQRVGASGRVVAADINTRLLRMAHLPENVEIREHDIRTQDLEPEYYDLAHCRAVLEHLEQPAAALRAWRRQYAPVDGCASKNATFAPSGQQTPTIQKHRCSTRHSMHVLTRSGGQGSWIAPMGGACLHSFDSSALTKSGQPAMLFTAMALPIYSNDSGLVHCGFRVCGLCW
jgi:SAM-dependent methyltransferase